MDERIVRWVGEGYQVGYLHPDAEPGIPLDEPWITYYRQGFEAGRDARREADARYGGPAIGPDLGGESWDAYERRWRELLEPIFHEHMPHIETETEVDVVIEYPAPRPVDPVP